MHSVGCSECHHSYGSGSKERSGDLDGEGLFVLLLFALFLFWLRDHVVQHNSGNIGPGVVRRCGHVVSRRNSDVAAKGRNGVAIANEAVVGGIASHHEAVVVIRGECSKAFQS